MFRSGENYVKPLLATTLVGWTKIHQHPSTAVVAVAHAHDDDIPFVALDVFQVLHEQAAEDVMLLAHKLSFQARAKIAVFIGEAMKGVLNFGLLGLGKRNYTNAQLILLWEEGANEMHDVGCFVGIGALLVNAIFHEMKTDAPSKGASAFGFPCSEDVTRISGWLSSAR